MVGYKLKKSRKIVRFVTKVRKVIAFIPNLFTLGNLFCGCLGIIYAFNWRLDVAAYMVFLAAFLDFFDGFIARLLKVSGELGKQLDSLADMVSFGVLPAIVMFLFIDLHIDINYLRCFSFPDPFAGGEMLPQPEIPTDCLFRADPTTYHPLAFIGLLIACFSAYRLAKFNLDARQATGFIGLPTPANAIFICSFVFCFLHTFGMTSFDLSLQREIGWTVYPPLSRPPFTAGLPLLHQIDYETIALKSMFFKLIYHPVSLVLISLLFSLLLVSEIPLFALKFKNFGWPNNKIRYIFLTVSAVLLILFQFMAIPFIVILYIFISIINNIFKITV